MIPFPFTHDHVDVSGTIINSIFDLNYLTVSVLLFERFSLGVEGFYTRGMLIKYTYSSSIGLSDGHLISSSADPFTKVW
jgi:hypothetical protein